MMNTLAKMPGVNPIDGSDAFMNLCNILNEAGYDVDEVGDGNVCLAYL